MNIPVTKLLSKMEAELVKAKTSSSDKEVREKVAVIQSLCELILENEKTEFQPIATPTSREVNQLELQKMMGNIPTVSKSPSSSTTKEADANGDSLFDF